MKATKMIFMAVCLFFAGQIFASTSFDSMKDRTESWLQGSDDPNLRGSRATTETEEGELFVGTPIHDGLYVLIVLAGVYMFVRKRRSTTSQQ